MKRNFKILMMVLFMIFCVFSTANAKDTISTIRINTSKEMIGRNVHLRLSIYRDDKQLDSFTIANYQGYFIEGNKLIIFKARSIEKDTYYHGDLFLYGKNGEKALIYKSLITSRTYERFPVCEATEPLYALPAVMAKIGKDMMSQVRLSDEFLPKNNNDMKIASLIKLARNKDLPAIKKILVPSDEYRSKPNMNKLVGDVSYLVRKNPIFAIWNLKNDYVFFFPKKENGEYKTLWLSPSGSKIEFILY